MGCTPAEHRPFPFRAGRPDPRGLLACSRPPVATPVATCFVTVWPSRSSRESEIAEVVASRTTGCPNHPPSREPEKNTGVPSCKYEGRYGTRRSRKERACESQRDVRMRGRFGRVASARELEVRIIKVGRRRLVTPLGPSYECPVAWSCPLCPSCPIQRARMRVVVVGLTGARAPPSASFRSLAALAPSRSSRAVAEMARGIDQTVWRSRYRV